MQKTLKELEKEFETNLSSGLSESQVEINREKYGKNELEEKKKTNIFIKFLLEFKDTLIIILLVAAIVSVIIDPSEYVESLIILFVVIVNAILGVSQESKAEKSLEALKNMSSPISKVIRDNKLISIPASEVVVGDILVCEAGDKISCDAVIIECSNLQVEEAALTGESLAVTKNNEYIENDDIPLGDRHNQIFQSTYITNGKCKALVTSVGMQTEIGKIAKMLNSTEDSLTPLQKKLDSVGKTIGIMSLAICLVVFILELISTRGENILEAFKTAVALAVAAIPEGLATVVTIVLAIGVTKMSKKNAIVKKLPAVETLGSTNVVCSDKTGTLTQNKMTVVKLYQSDLIDLKDDTTLNDEEKKLVNYFSVCCDASISEVDGVIKEIGDPTEVALIYCNNKYGYENIYSKVLDLPFDSDRKLMTTVLKVDNKYISITKGAPDVVISRSINDGIVLDKALNVNKQMAQDALRVLALAVKQFDYLPNELELEKDLEFLGLVGMIDPARVEVAPSIALAHKAGIKTIMITGDHIVTASAIAKQLGILDETSKAITSTELDKLDDDYLYEHISEYSVYARVAPKDKVRIVDAWQKHDCVVAMTGDGVNDAPALKKADIGCAMGITGTDVSKEAADMILTDDNFATIIEAVKQGRGIYNNIQKCVKYLLSSNIGEVVTIFVASLLGAILSTLNFGVPLLPIHLLWINLITDSLPAFGIAMEEVDDDVMSASPRNKNESFFANKLGYKIAFEGFAIGLLTLIAYIIGNRVDHTLGQTMAFFTLSSTQLFHAYSVKSNHSVFSKHTFKNKFMNFAFLLGFLLQFIVLYTPKVNDLFKLTPLSLPYLLICLGLSLTMVLIMEISKLVSRIKAKNN